ncbi:hypothetical protein RND71_034390 [Anisodus tanguticus]|uniref:Uncharacterized protein n=1 Tax=Anisodus tanguticus TaxID=243964 RepID=A0AAE1RBA8_9SOLA|nr:hypothetical protein RND71_034390 [Anisodus tanguticus]
MMYAKLIDAISNMQKIIVQLFASCSFCNIEMFMVQHMLSWRYRLSNSILKALYIAIVSNILFSKTLGQYFVFGLTKLKWSEGLSNSTLCIN